MAASQSLLILLCGPAGSGKTTLCERMLEAFPGIRRVVTSTTRPPRPGETHAKDYYFFDQATFLRMRDEGAFYETAQVHDRWYGTLRSEVDDGLASGVDLLLNIDVQGAGAFRREAVSNPVLNGRLVSVFIMPPSMDEIRRRMLSRGCDDEQEIQRRLHTAEMEIREGRNFDHVIVSGSRDQDFAALQAFYRSVTGNRHNNCKQPNGLAN